jgi:hypothetical protein
VKRVIARYTVKPERAAENEELVRAVYAELHQTRPAGLRYATYQLDDGVSFVHVAATKDGQNPLAEVQAFKRFQENIDERCIEKPVVSSARELGSYSPGKEEEP